MAKKLVRKMLRQMESGQPVRLTISMMTWKKLTRLAYFAEQFGYEYANVYTSSDYKTVLTIVPDPRPQARERAAQNRVRYPDATDGVSLPPVEPDALKLLKTRMLFDLNHALTEKQRAAIWVTVFSVLAAAIAFRFHADTAVVVTTLIVWATLMALLPVLLHFSRRQIAENIAQLEAAGFIRVTDELGRPQYVRPDRRLPGHGNPFAREA
ncbi:hypothetical protein [Streptomyces geranii]|uniref:hypothetical protein n=1 Tax=Streptomyces geranii TaxID=2058923 RepID=UPI000D02EF3D|nr:hypothetical protein [Streptomyces geranii]